MIRNGKKYLISEKLSVKDAMVKMDKNGEKILFVVDDENKLIGSLTDGDIRRWILANGDIFSDLSLVYNKKPRFLEIGYENEKVKKLMLSTRLEWIPVVDENKCITDILVWNEVFGGKNSKVKKQIDVPVVVMAGGSGTRMEPFTNILPKPLIPIQGRPIIEVIMNKYKKYGVKTFYISVNYKSHIIKAYFDEVNTDYNINYISEHSPLGTAGCLRNLSGKIRGSLIVTNCDIIIESDYGEIVDFHLKNKNDITIVGSLRHYVIPYGICEIKNGGMLEDIREKPAYDYFVNTGMYVLDASAIKHIPHNKKFHMTDLIKKLKSSGGKVMVFPISEKSWIDVGQWEEYHKAIKQFKNV